MAALATLTLISAAGRSILAVQGISLPKETGQLDSLAFNLIVSLWVHFDRLGCGFHVPFEFDAFVFFAWPFVVPWYLYRRRGRRGLLHAAATYGFAIFPSLAALVVRILVAG